MATISTSQTLDSAARTAGEAMTINSGAILTLVTLQEWITEQQHITKE